MSCICEIPSICQMRMHYCPGQKKKKRKTPRYKLQLLSHRCSCQPTLTHSTTHHLKSPCRATRWLVSSVSPVSDSEQMFGSLCVSGRSQEAQREGQQQVRLGVTHCGHMIHLDQVFGTPWATPGWIWVQSTNLQGWVWGQLLCGI